MSKAQSQAGYDDYKGSRGAGGPASLDLDYLRGWHKADSQARQLDEEMPDYIPCPRCQGEDPGDCDHCGGRGVV